MAAISETELQKRLKKLESGITGNTPSANRAGATWEYADPVLYLAYAEGFAVGSLSDDGVVELQEYVNGFGFSPFNAAGSLKPWRGFLFSKSRYASGDPTDYIWEEVDVASANAQFERHYTITPYLQAFVGSPSEVVTGVTWVSISVGTPIPDAALYVAERYEINGVMSQWVVYPVNSRETGTPLSYFTITGRDSIPELNTNEWDEDAILAMESHTGYSFSSVREFGYGTAVVIDYPPHGKQWGLYKRNPETGVGYWVTAQFLDGDLIVSNSIHASAIAANQIQANHLLVEGPNGITPETIGAPTVQEVNDAITNDTTVIDGSRITTGTIDAARISLFPYQVGAGAQDIAGQTRLVIDGTKISIWEGNVERVRLGAL